MTMLSTFEQDILVCFADIDNEILPGGKIGWVDQLVRCLTQLVQEAGFKEPRVRAHIEGNVPLADRAVLVRRAATVVVVLSPAFLESDWCTNNTLVAALAAEGQRRPESIFVAEKSVTERGLTSAYDEFRHDELWTMVRGVSRPLGTPDLEGSNDRGAYYEVAISVANAVARRLQDLARPMLRTGSAAPRVLLAEVGADVKARRAQAQRYLEQAGFEVEPRGRLPVEPAALEAAMLPLLVQCRAFVQILGTDDYARSVAQLDVAAASGIPVMQWRDEALDMSKIDDADLRALLMRSTVRAETITDFCRAVSRLAEKEPAPPSGPAPSVFVDVRQEHANEVERIFKRYQTIQWDWHQPKGLSALRTIVRGVDGVIVYWGSGESDLTQQRYRVIVSHFKALKKPLDRLLIYDGPPPAKPPFKGLNFPLANGRNGDEPAELRRFLKEIHRAG